jgi:hypothetical protein
MFTIAELEDVIPLVRSSVPPTPQYDWPLLKAQTGVEVVVKHENHGSKPLKNNLHERYARLRAAAMPRIVAFRKAGNTAKNDHVADANSFRLERKPGVRERLLLQKS